MDYRKNPWGFEEGKYAMAIGIIAMLIGFPWFYIDFICGKLVWNSYSLLLSLLSIITIITGTFFYYKYNEENIDKPISKVIFFTIKITFILIGAVSAIFSLFYFLFAISTGNLNLKLLLPFSVALVSTLSAAVMIKKQV